jgi:hypothetical protein
MRRLRSAWRRMGLLTRSTRSAGLRPRHRTRARALRGRDAVPPRGRVRSPPVAVRGLLLALAAVGCGGGCRPSGEAPPEPSPGKVAAGQALVPDDQGRVERSTTGTTGIQGRWTASTDAEDCQTKGKHAAAECSKLITPDPRSPRFAPTGDLGMCMVGVAAKVILRSDGRIDYAHIWGAPISLSLQDGASYDAPAHGVTGFAFHVDAEPPPRTLRVVLATATAPADSPFWGGVSSEMSPVHAGHNEFRWADVGGPIWADNPPRFDPTRLISISFVVPADPNGAKAFSFCIDQLTALTN